MKDFTAYLKRERARAEVRTTRLTQANACNESAQRARDCTTALRLLSEFTTKRTSDGLRKRGKVDA